MDYEEMKFTLLKDDLQTYRNIENWGLGILLSGIVVVTKQIFEWSQKDFAAWFQNHTDAGAIVAALPVFIGLIGSVMLLIINRRGRQVRSRFEKSHLKPRGVLGWYFAGLPFGLGSFASIFLVMSGFGGCLAANVVLLGGVIFLWEIRENAKLKSDGVPDLLSIADAARLLGVSEADVLSTLEKGELKGKKIGSTWRVTKAALDEFLKS